MTDWIDTPRIDAFFTLSLLAFAFFGSILLSWALVTLAKRLNKWLERTRPMATRLPRGERRPDAMQKEMQESYDEASRRG